MGANWTGVILPLKLSTYPEYNDIFIILYEMILKPNAWTETDQIASWYVASFSQAKEDRVESGDWMTKSFYRYVVWQYCR